MKESSVLVPVVHFGCSSHEPLVGLRASTLGSGFVVTSGDFKLNAMALFFAEPVAMVIMQLVRMTQLFEV